MEGGWGLPVWWSAGVEGACVEHWMPEEELAEEADAPISQPGLGLVLRIIQGQQEVGKRRKSKNHSLCRGLVTPDLHLPQLHSPEPGLRGRCQVGMQELSVPTITFANFPLCSCTMLGWGNAKGILHHRESRLITIYEKEDLDGQE